MASTGVVDIFLVYQFLRRLATPFEKWEAFKTGVIDKEGKVIIGKRERAEDNAIWVREPAVLQCKAGCDRLLLALCFNDNV